MKLTDNYSWEEIANLFADRIEQSQFIEEKLWNRKKFVEWFMERERVGLRFDWKLVARAYIIWLNLQKEHDHFTVIVGGEGSGKSTLAAQFSSWISPNMDLNDMVFDMQHYVKKLKEVAKDYKQNKLDHNDRSIIIDEGGLALFSREALSQSNKVLAKTFMIQRFLNVHVVIYIPYYWNIDTLVRNHRINSLIIIKQRGKYKTIVGKGIKILNKLGEKDKLKDLPTIPIPYGLFWDGDNHKYFPNNIDKEEYEKHKFKHIVKFLTETEKEAEKIKKEEKDTKKSKKDKDLF